MERFVNIKTHTQGASVVRMLERLLGEVNLRNILRIFIRRHMYGTVTVPDLVDVLRLYLDGNAHAADSIPRAWDNANVVFNVTTMLHCWVSRIGFPVVSTQRHNGIVRLTQKRFVLGGGTEDEKSIVKGCEDGW